jgi:hypothetical protein
MRETPDFAKQKFLYRLSRSDYEREWGKTYEKPGLGTRFLAILLRLVPAIGPFKGLGFNNPTPQTEDLYIKSINTTTDHYTALLKTLHAGNLELPNRNLDDGNPTAPGEYSLADESYASLLTKLAAHKFNETSAQLRDNILKFYADPSGTVDTAKNPARWQAIQTDLSQLKAVTPTAAPATHGADQKSLF